MVIELAGYSDGTFSVNYALLLLHRSLPLYVRCLQCGRLVLSAIKLLECIFPFHRPTPSAGRFNSMFYANHNTLGC
jgi:hypothetical protein